MRHRGVGEVRGFARRVQHTRQGGEPTDRGRSMVRWRFHGLTPTQVGGPYPWFAAPSPEASQPGGSVVRVTGAPKVHDRRERILEHIDVERGRGLEFGPLDRPVVRTSDGDVRYIDHQSTSGLRAKYADHPLVDVGSIVDVDHVLDGRPLVELVDADFDYVIASHVMEHVPDPVGWLVELSEVLRPGGLISLVVPDMRTTFDCGRPLTAPSDLLAAHMEQRSAPTVEQVIEHHLFALRRGDRIAWGEPVDRGELEPVHDTDYVMDRAARACQGEYVDVHCWVFTPESFLMNITVLQRLGRVGVQARSVAPGDGEFFVTLEVTDVERGPLPDQWDRSLRVGSAVPDTGGDQAARVALDAVYSSTSWRVTAPLRRITDIIRTAAGRLSGRSGSTSTA